MSFKLPPQNHKARELMGDMATLAVTLDPANAAKLPAIHQACSLARKSFEACSNSFPRICYVILKYDTCERWLISVGPKGGWRKEWNFGDNQS